MIGKAVNPPLQAAYQLLEGFEVAASRLPDQLAGLDGASVGRAGHRAGSGSLDMHLP
jgi:hypothetical protein